jgi:hypothetical protein
MTIIPYLLRNQEIILPPQQLVLLGHEPQTMLLTWGVATFLETHVHLPVEMFLSLCPKPVILSDDILHLRHKIAQGVLVGALRGFW